MSGESPILPGIFNVNPPVEVAAAVLPFPSSATAPTVSVSNRFGCDWSSCLSLGRFFSSPMSSFCFSSFQ